MRVAITNPALHALCNYRSVPVATPFGQGHQYVLFCSHREQGNECHWKKNDTTKNNPALMMSDFSGPYRNAITQTPIALPQCLTPCLHPAVSSLKACKTPAR